MNGRERVMVVPAAPASDLAGAAEHVLASWTASADVSAAGPDLGPAVLATLLPDGEVVRAATRAWLRAGTRCRGGTALFGGTAGVLAGLRLVAARRPCVAPAAERAAAAVAGSPSRWRTSSVGFDDYDVVRGPSGVLLAHLTGPMPVRPERFASVIGHLTAVEYRIGAHAGHRLTGWAQGGVVTGLAHGVAGPIAALAAAGERDALSGRAAWLAAHRFTGPRGVVSWPGRVPGPRRGARRQGWCYGTPGVAWALWTAGQTEVAVEAMESLCAAYDPDLHLDHDPLSVCHGVAGVLLVADAFARHAGLPAAAALRDELAGHLTERLDEVTRLDASLLTGAPGVLAALLTAAGGDRGWLPCLALY